MTSQRRSRPVMVAFVSLALPVLAVSTLVLSACSTPPAANPTPSDESPASTPSPSATPTDEPRGPVQPAGDPKSLADGLETPWSILRLADGTVLVSERDSAQIHEVRADGSHHRIAVVPNVAPGGEGGLLGLAALEEGGKRFIYAYQTAANSNRIVRMELGDDLHLGPPQKILGGLAKSGNHNGGRIAFGPDGMLYATVGDAAQPSRSQDKKSLNGKILRMTPTGEVPADNPFAGSLVYSMGHRNPQGIAWDDDGQLWASEFGQDTWDEFNKIEAGGNYGWPTVEGKAGRDGFIDPVLQWRTDEASPSGLTYVDGTFFMAALRGARVWAIYPDSNGGADAVAWFEGDFGRIRDVAPGPDGTLWFLTHNTDGRGTARAGDDHLYEVRLVPLEEG